MNALAHDIAAFAGSIGLVIAYHAWLQFTLRRNPDFTVHAVNKVARVKWVERIMTERGLEVLAVQTLRNSMMSASFMASTAVLLMIGTFTLSASGSERGAVWHALNIGTVQPDALATKLILLLADFFVAFFFFAMAVRFFNHVGYLISLPAAGGMAALEPARVGAYLNRAGLCYVIGLRAFFFCVPLVFWLFGPQFMFGSTIVVIAGLYVLDRAPR